MKYFGRYGDVSYVIKKRGPMEFVPVVAGVSLAPGETLNQAVEIAVDSIRNGVRTEFKSTFSWPDSPSTSRDVSLKKHENCENFCDMMFRALGKGGSVLIEQIGGSHA